MKVAGAAAGPVAAAAGSARNPAAVFPLESTALFFRPLLRSQDGADAERCQLGAGEPWKLGWPWLDDRLRCEPSHHPELPELVSRWYSSNQVNSPV